MKLLIVDDESRTRELLRQYIAWEEAGITEVETARNGLVALEVATRWKPDIILCDVLMPKMNGIEFVRRYREMDSDCKILFLSGFSDKEYLKSAIHLQALTYLEKPVNLVEVKSAVESAVQLRHLEKEKNEVERQLQADYDLSLPVLRREMVRKLISDPTAVHVAPALRSQDIFLLPDHGPYTVAAATLYWNPPELPEDPELVQSRLLEAVNRHPLMIARQVLAGFDANHYMVLIIPGTYGSTYRLGREVIEELSAELQQLAGPAIDLRVGIGEPAAQMEGIPRAYKSAVAVCGLQFYGHSKKPLFMDELGGNDALDTDWEGIRSLREHLRLNRIEEARMIIINWTREVVKRRDLDILRVKDSYFQFIFAIMEVAVQLGYAERTEDLERVYLWKEMDRVPSLSALEAYVMTFLDSFAASAAEGHSAGTGKIREIVLYIRSHSQEKSFTIRSIADQFKLSETYLCSYFKKQRGQTIKEFITETRMAKAKELLRDMELKLYEVAERLGFVDANYFTVFFKRNEGCTPSEYRERMGQ